MRYRTIDVRLWGDEKFRVLSSMQPSGQGLFLYLLTNPNTTTIPGLYRAGAAGMAEELSWTTEGFLKAFQEVLRQGLVKADFDARVIFIPNAIKFNKPQSPNVVKSWASHWDEIPECGLKNIAYQSLKSFVDGMGKAFAEAFSEAIDKTMPNQEQEQKQEKEQENKDIREADASLMSASDLKPSASILEVFSYWQEVMGHPGARLDKKRKAAIFKALKDYGVDDLKHAIDGCFKTPHNMGATDGQRYDDIGLIFRDAGQIERFMSNAITPPPPVKSKHGSISDMMEGAI